MDELPSMEPFSHDLETEKVDATIIRDGINISSTVEDLPLAPPLTFNKFLTMQVRPVVVYCCESLFSSHLSLFNIVG